MSDGLLIQNIEPGFFYREYYTSVEKSSHLEWIKKEGNNIYLYRRAWSSFQTDNAKIEKYIPKHTPAKQLTKDLSKTNFNSLAALTNPEMTESCSSLSVSKDGKILLSTVHNRIYLWSVSDKKLIREIKTNYDGPVYAEIAPDGNSLGYTTSSEFVQMNLMGKRVSSFKYVSQKKLHGSCTKFTFAPDGESIAIPKGYSLFLPGSYWISFRTLDGKQSRGSFVGAFDSLRKFEIIRNLRLSPDGRFAITETAYSMAEMEFTHIRPLGKNRKNYININFPRSNIAYSPDGKTYAICSTIDYNRFGYGISDDEINIYSVNDRNFVPLKKIKPIQFGAITSLTFSPDGKFLAIGSVKGDVRFYGVGGEKLGSYSAHDDRVVNLIFTPDGKHLISQSRDNSINILSK